MHVQLDGAEDEFTLPLQFFTCKSSQWYSVLLHRRTSLPPSGFRERSSCIEQCTQFAVLRCAAMAGRLDMLQLHTNQHACDCIAELQLSGSTCGVTHTHTEHSRELLLLSRSARQYVRYRYTAQFWSKLNPTGHPSWIPQDMQAESHRTCKLDPTGHAS